MECAMMEEYLTRLEEKTKEHHYPREMVTEEARSRWFDSAKDQNGNVPFYAKSCFDSTGEDIYLKKHSDFYVGRFSYPHYHDFFEFNFVCRGSCVNIVDGNRIVQTPDTLILMNL
ncbi:MAG: hypothetical protein HFE85_02580, partial [Clostridiales bacterium]|nr:hypothetical protein [Clostridiales bacterium]